MLTLENLENMIQQDFYTKDTYIEKMISGGGTPMRDLSLNSPGSTTQEAGIMVPFKKIHQLLIKEPVNLEDLKDRTKSKLHSLTN
jgi:hypothetical protein